MPLYPRNPNSLRSPEKIISSIMIASTIQIIGRFIRLQKGAWRVHFESSIRTLFQRQSLEQARQHCIACKHTSMVKLVFPFQSLAEFKVRAKVFFVYLLIVQTRRILYTSCVRLCTSFKALLIYFLFCLLKKKKKKGFFLEYIPSSLIYMHRISLSFLQL